MDHIILKIIRWSLLGTVIKVGAKRMLKDPLLEEGMRIVPFVSLSTLPLHLESVKFINGPWVQIEGVCIMNGACIWYEVPSDILLAF